MKNNLILSTCGTSILSHNKSNEERGILIKNANARTKEDISSEDLKVIEEIIDKSTESLLDGSLEKAIELSAELSGIIHYYEKSFSKKSADIHYLLPTDTFLGKETTEIIRSYLVSNGLKNVNIMDIKDLQTSNFELFSYSLSDLTKQLHENLEDFRSSYKIVFNLSGGFKSESGFLQVMGMFYADETIYIFEKSDNLMRIPKLNIAFNDKEEVVNNLADFRRANMGLVVERRTKDIYWSSFGGEWILTPWGDLAFDQCKKELYGERVWPSISKKVVFGEKFLKSCENEKNHYYEINDKIDKLAQYAEKKKHVSSLDFKQLKGGKHKGCTHEFDAWHDGGAKRGFCRVEGDTIIIEVISEGLH